MNFKKKNCTDNRIDAIGGMGNMSPGMMNSGLNQMNQRPGLGNVSGGSMRGKLKSIPTTTTQLT